METSTVEEWLERTGRPRTWLAEQCNVSINTVKGWLSAGRPIQGAAEKLIRILMSEGQKLDLDFTLEEWEQISERAAAVGMTSRDWIKDVLRQEIAKPQAQPVETGRNRQTAKNATSYSNITPLPKQSIAADDGEQSTEETPTQKVNYGSGRKKAK